MLSDDEILGLWSEGKAHAPARPVLGSKKVIAFARAVERAAYERAAQACEACENRVVKTHPARVEFDPNSMMARKCAITIRALGEQHD